MELLCHLRKRENAARDPLAQGIQNAACVQCGLPPRKIQLLKISPDRLRTVQRYGAACCVLHGMHILVQHLRYAAAFQLKTIYHALCRAAASLPVAAPGGLQKRVQPALFPVCGGEIHIHTGFDQRGGNHPAGQPFPQPLPDLCQLAAAVCGA